MGVESRESSAPVTPCSAPSFCDSMHSWIGNRLHDNKSKWNFYLTNHKRLRFIGAEKYSRQTKCATHTTVELCALFFLSSFRIMLEFNIVFSFWLERCAWLSTHSRTSINFWNMDLVGNHFHFIIGTNTTYYIEIPKTNEPKQQ